MLLYVWKMARFVPIYKEESNQLVKNYSLGLLIPACGKIFEQLNYNETCHYRIDNNLISLNQSDFKEGGFCINQLLPIAHEKIYLIKHLMFMKCSYTF